ncbi:MAG: ZIP family metal transporter [Candidatus Omnitrophica bacterium]|nr:ZIP family metal transporter [Candidatus Omnitrophota bacterium]
MARLLLAVLMAGAGAFIAVGFKRISHLGLCLLISFAAGALLAVALFDIFPESVALSGLLSALVSFVSGYLLFLIITRFVFHICPACAATHTEVEFKAVTLPMIVALSIHSFMDGLAISGGHALPEGSGLLILSAVAYHKLPEGLALALVARSSGMNRSKSFFLSFSVEAITTLAGGICGMMVFPDGASPALGFALGHVGGGFVFLVFHALLGEAFRHHPRSTILAAVLGSASIGLIGLLA